jgi:hypothetical protein
MNHITPPRRRALAAAAFGLAALATGPALASFTAPRLRTMPSCTWQAGRQRYTGTRADAIARLAAVLQLQPWQLQWLAQSMAQRPEGDDRVHITSAAITGQRHAYHPHITHMHFGPGHLCQRVDRSRWVKADHEAGLVWLVPGTQAGLLLPAVCGNWAIVHLRLQAEGNTSGHGAGRLLEPMPSAAPHSQAGQDLAAWPMASGAADAAAPAAAGNAQGPGLDASKLAPLAVLQLPGADWPASPGIEDAPTWAGAAQPPQDAPTPSPWPTDDAPPITGGGDTWPAMPAWPAWPTPPAPPGLLLPPEPLPPIPEPPASVLAATGLAALLWVVRRRKRLAAAGKP